MATTGSPMRMLAGSASVAGGRLGVDVDTEQGQVVVGIGGDHRGRRRLGVAGEAHTHVLGAGDDVGVGEDLTVGRDDHTRADRLAGQLAVADGRADGDDAGRDGGGDGGNVDAVGARLLGRRPAAGS